MTSAMPVRCSIQLHLISNTALHITFLSRKMVYWDPVINNSVLSLFNSNLNKRWKLLPRFQYRDFNNCNRLMFLADMVKSFWTKWSIKIGPKIKEHWLYSYPGTSRHSIQPFATNDHMVQNPPCWRASSLLFPHWDIKTKASQASPVQVSLL